jgi:hypothetical protein
MGRRRTTVRNAVFYGHSRVAKLSIFNWAATKKSIHEPVLRIW